METSGERARDGAEIAQESRKEAVRDVVLLLDLALARTRASRFQDGELKDSICTTLETTKRELGRFEEEPGATDSARLSFDDASEYRYSDAEAP